jgi:hypothetical protein
VELLDPKPLEGRSLCIGFRVFAPLAAPRDEVLEEIEDEGGAEDSEPD